MNAYISLLASYLLLLLYVNCVNIEGVDETINDNNSTSIENVVPKRSETPEAPKRISKDKYFFRLDNETKTKEKVKIEPKSYVGEELIGDDEMNVIRGEEIKIHKKIMNEMLEALLEHEFGANATRTHKYESITPLKEGEELSGVIVDESFLKDLNDIDWQMTMEKMHHTLWNYWNNEFHKEYVQRIPSALRQLRTISKRLGLSSLFEEGAFGDTINQLNPKTKNADRRIQKLFKKMFENESKLETVDIKYKRAEESIINMVIELKGYIRIFLKLIDIKASQVGLLLLNKVQRKNFAKLTTNINMFRDHVKNCPVHTAFNYRYSDLNFDLIMHHEKGFGVWNTAQSKTKINNSNENARDYTDIENNIDEIINFVYNEFITPIALIGSSIEDITLINSSLIRTLWRNISTQHKIPLYNIFEAITKATFFFIKQINEKIYEINNR
ncbi:hypothetical protein FG386_001342 [Cryptosporidium ryanae]|uniref:uncharacterized protein n=1 Tax=Cryptosporidium ryanae TaxID=515981 RepID=UPI00351A852F|nr:hypothetical protein FG386_001342 [Cryptosporidium ryanae]